VLVVIGARAAGLALLGSVIGSATAVFMLADDFDRVLSGALIGGGLGIVVFGLAGLAWRPSASRAVLGALAWVTAGVGGAVVLAVHLTGERCRVGGRGGVRCHQTADGLPLLIALNAAFVVLMFALQAAEADRSIVAEAQS
jgi:hypothetical protein